MEKPIIMVVEDETIVSRGIQQALGNMGYETPAAARTGEQAVSRALAEMPDLVLMDITLKGEMDGIEAARQIRAASDIPIIFLTAYADDEKIERAKFVEPFGYIIKPFDERELKVALETGLHKAKMERRLKESEAKYRLIVENQNDLVVKFDTLGRLLFVSPTYCKTFGRMESELIGEKFMPLIHQEDWERVTESIRSLKTPPHTSHHEARAMTVAGWRWFGWSLRAILDKASAIGEVISVGRDITERKALEKQLRQAQKMEAIGTLAGGIAHDFNNILSSILGFTELSLDQVSKDSELYDNLQEVLISGKRARDLVRQILDFSRPGDRKENPIDMETLLQEAKGLLRATIPTTIRMESTIREEGCVIEGDAGQIHRVILNLATNAAQAMEEEGGQLEMILEKTECHIPEGEIPPGKYVRLTVKDTGHGIAPEVMDRIFDPYFTTREVGKGTGMGLAMVHGIVKSNGGYITVESREGEGTAFRVYLPLSKETESHVEPFKNNALPGGDEQILVVDDEPQIVNFQKQALERLGYRVKAETDSMAALETFGSAPGTFDAVVTDMTMPQMTGDKLARELRKIRPDIPIILCTGYSDKISKKKAKEMGINAFLMKPVGTVDLTGTLRRILDN